MMTLSYQSKMSELCSSWHEADIGERLLNSLSSGPGDFAATTMRN